VKFVFFSVSENVENGLGDEGVDGGNADLNAPSHNFWAITALADLRFKEDSFSMYIIHTSTLDCTQKSSFMHDFKEWRLQVKSSCFICFVRPYATGFVSFLFADIIRK